jgi:outer membrane protein assembly factor BamE (lipoprotein component of BamABCDE complex)
MNRRFLSLLFRALACGALLTGCKTPDESNVSARPWNQPRGWENGLPAQMFEGR